MAILLMSVSLLASVCRADNPVIQTKFTADPAPMVYKNTVYLYTGQMRMTLRASRCATGSATPPRTW